MDFTLQDLGAAGELVGALAVLLTLGFLAKQMRDNTRTMAENNRLQRASAVDRHNDSISRWRGRIMENEDLARIWLAARNDEPLDDLELMRLQNMWIDFINTQRSNFVRASAVDADQLAFQTAMSVAAEIGTSALLSEAWERGRPWNKLASPEFVETVTSILRAPPPEADAYPLFTSTRRNG